MIKEIAKNSCLIVAEISANHRQDFKTAVKLIKEAKRCGADAVKFQAYTPDSLTIDVKNRYFTVKHPKWGGQSLYQLYKKTYTPLNWFKGLKKRADDAGITFFATAFDRITVDLLESLDVPFHKIASFELVDLPLIEYAAKTRKPLILSTGMGTLLEIKKAVATAKKAGAEKIVLLKCTSEYPAREKDMNLSAIPLLAKIFKYPVGLSDHTLGSAVAVAAVALGAVMIEKHFSLSNGKNTPDSFFSLDPNSFRRMVEDVRTVEKALGVPRLGPSRQEKKNLLFRRSLFAVRDIKRGERFTDENIKSIRPGYGLPPKHLNSILGRETKKNIKMGTPLKWEMITGR